MTVAEETENVFRDQWGRLLALLVAQFRRLDLAEEGLADAFAAAADRWPTDGVPRNLAGWLLTAARRRVLDRLRAEAVAARKEPLLVVEARLTEEAQQVQVEAGEQISDERLRLIFLCAHPALAPEAGAALSLRLVLGVSTADIARLFLVPEPTMAARLTRAKRKLAVAGVPFTLPAGPALGGRLAAVTTAVYLAFTAGYAPGSGPDATRVALAGEAIRLVRTLRRLLPRPEVDALLALMVLQHARRDARTDPEGRLVLLPDQDRSRWRSDEVDEGLSLLQPMLRRSWSGVTGEYFLQALIAAEHVMAARAEDTRWDRIAAHYAELERLTGSPVVRLNRAVAVSEAEGPAAGLALLDGLDVALPRSHRLAAVRGALLADLGRTEPARAAYAVALELCGNDLEAQHLRSRLAALTG
jgi:predicted RNA polymerase sigma factor